MRSDFSLNKYSGGLPVVPVCARRRHRYYSERPALFRATGTTANSANTGTIEGSKSLSSAGSGTTDDYLIVKCSAYALRG